MSSGRKTLSFSDGRGVRTSYKVLKKRLASELAQPDRQRRKVAENLLRQSFPTEYWAEREAEHAAVLLKQNQHRWSRYLESPSQGISQAQPISYEHFNENSFNFRQLKKPVRQLNRVSDFTGWVFEMDHGQSDPRSLAAGKIGERGVARKRRVLRTWPLDAARSGWECIDQDPLSRKPDAREISLLNIGTNSLWGAPDYAFYNAERAEILIVEVKFTDYPVAPWPNLQAQLWAYGHIDHYLELAKRITLIGEIWGSYYRGAYRLYPTLRQTYRWQLFDADFYARNEKLFNLYRCWVTGNA